MSSETKAPNEPDNTPAARPLSRTKVIIYSLLPLAALLTLLEGGARILEIFQPPMPVDYGWGFNEDSQLFQLRDGTASVRPQKQVSFGTEPFPIEKPSDEYRVVAIGGSNVNFLDWRFQQIEQQLGEEFEGRRVHIINCGGNSYGTTRLLRVLDEALGFDPDLVLIYSGHNEFEEQRQATYVRLSTLGLQRTLYASAFFRKLRDSWARETMAALENDPEAVRFMQDGGDANFHARVMADYESNLRTMIARSRDGGAAVLLGTLGTNYFEPDLLHAERGAAEQLRALYAVGNYEGGLAKAKSLLAGIFRTQACQVENGIVQRVAEETGVTLIDFVAPLEAGEPHGVMGETLFSDQCHMNPDGQAIWMETVLPELRARMASAS